MKIGHTDQILVLIFHVDTPAGSIACGLNIHKVREVVETTNLSVLPSEYAPFIALHDLRGIPTPVMPLDAVFQGSHELEKNREKARILIIELQEKTIGLLVASTGRIQSFSSAEVREPPAALEGVKARFFNGVLRTDKGYIYLLDIEAILHSSGFSLDGECQIDGQTPIFQGKRVLVVEDSKLYQKKIKQIFSAWGCELDFANHGQEGLDLLKKNNFLYDLVFTDIEMPIMGGIEFAKALKNLPEGKGMPILFNSSLSNPRLIEEVKALGLGEYIIKFNQEIIHEEVAKILGVKAA
ncbi:MAG: chemotaxis protein CheW [Bdellovibrionota bacterium]